MHCGGRERRRGRRWKVVVAGGGRSGERHLVVPCGQHLLVIQVYARVGREGVHEGGVLVAGGGGREEVRRRRRSRLYRLSLGLLLQSLHHGAGAGGVDAEKDGGGGRRQRGRVRGGGGGGESPGGVRRPPGGEQVPGGGRGGAEPAGEDVVVVGVLLLLLLLQQLLLVQVFALGLLLRSCVFAVLVQAAFPLVDDVVAVAAAATSVGASSELPVLAEALGKWVVIDLQLRYAFVLVGCHSQKAEKCSELSDLSSQ